MHVITDRPSDTFFALKHFARGPEAVTHFVPITGGLSLFTIMPCEKCGVSMEGPNAITLKRATPAMASMAGLVESPELGDFAGFGDDGECLCFDCFDKHQGPEGWTTINV